MKKIFLAALGVLLGVGVSTMTINAQSDEFYYNTIDTTQQADTELWTYVHDDVIDEQQGFVQRLLALFGLDQYASWTNPATGETYGATNFIVRLTNLALSLSAFVAFLVLVYGFAMMLFSSEEDGIAKARKYIVWAAIAIAILGVSWFIVSWIFYAYRVIQDF